MRQFDCKSLGHRVLECIVKKQLVHKVELGRKLGSREALNKTGAILLNVTVDFHSITKFIRQDNLSSFNN